MSQAVAAPSTGDVFVAPGNMPIATAWSAGKSGGVSPSRRGLLAGMLLLPGIAAAVATPAYALSGSWVEAMRTLDAAKAADAAFLRRPDWSEEACYDESERLTTEVCRAEDAIMDVPAPDLSAVIWKIEYARKRWEDFDGWPDEWWAAILSDLRRIAALAPAGALAA